MKLICILVILAFSFKSVSAQTNVKALKFKIIREIVDDLEKKQKDRHIKNEIGITCLIDTRYRSAYYNSGFAGEAIYYSDYLTDYTLIDSLANTLDSNKYIFAEKNSLNTYRNLTIRSSSFQPINCGSNCVKLYIEIGVPTDGWENLYFYSLLNDQKINDTLLLRCNVPQICIPVFVYRQTNSAVKIEKYIYCFNIIMTSHKVNTVFKSILKLYPLQ